MFGRRSEPLFNYLSMKEIEKRKVNIMGMELEQWIYGGCVANFGVGNEWATLYDILSKNQGKGEATHLLKEAKKYYEGLGKVFGGSIALNSRMRDIYKRLEIKEYI